jgi:hypothetical protein
VSRTEVFRRDPEFPEGTEELKHKPFERLSNMDSWPRPRKRPRAAIIHMMPRTAMTMAASELVTKELLEDV